MCERSLWRHSVASTGKKIAKIDKEIAKIAKKNRHIGNFMVILSGTSNTVSPKWARVHAICLGLVITWYDLLKHKASNVQFWTLDSDLTSSERQISICHGHSHSTILRIYLVILFFSVDVTYGILRLEGFKQDKIFAFTSRSRPNKPTSVLISSTLIPSWTRQQTK